MKTLLNIASFISVGLLTQSSFAASYTMGNLVVSRSGNGAATLSGSAEPVFIDEYTTAGVNAGNTVALPVVASGTNFTFTLGGTSTSVGQLTRSTDGKYLTMFGVDAPVGTSSPTASAAFPGRTVARIDSGGTVDTRTRFLGNGMTPRSAISTDGNSLWTTGDTGSGTTGGLRYNTLGSTVNGTLLTDAAFTTNLRFANIFNGQLYVSSSSATASVASRGVNKIGTGIPTTGGNAGVNLIGGGASGAGLADSTYDFLFGDANTAYLADDSTTVPGIQKWSFNGTSWVKLWNLTPAGTTGVRSLTSTTDATGQITIYAVTGVSTGSNAIVSLLDTLSSSTAPLASAYVTVATAPANTAFSGIDFAPVPEPTTLGVVAGMMTLARRRRA